MKNTHHLRFLCLSVFTAVFVLAVSGVQAANPIRISVSPGVTVLEVGGQNIQVETTAPVVVVLRVSGDSVQGSVELEAGTQSATVTITVLGPPDRVIFDARVVGIRSFREYIPKETGQGEM